MKFIFTKINTCEIWDFLMPQFGKFGIFQILCPQAYFQGFK